MKNKIADYAGSGGLLGGDTDNEKAIKIKAIEDSAGLNESLTREERDEKNRIATERLRNRTEATTKKVSASERRRGQIMRDPYDIEKLEDCMSDEEKVAFIEMKLMPEIRRKHLEEDPELGKYNDYIESAWAESILNEDLYK